MYLYNIAKVNNRKINIEFFQYSNFQKKEKKGKKKEKGDENKEKKKE